MTRSTLSSCRWCLQSRTQISSRPRRSCGDSRPRLSGRAKLDGLFAAAGKLRHVRRISYPAPTHQKRRNADECNSVHIHWRKLIQRSWGNQQSYLILLAGTCARFKRIVFAERETQSPGARIFGARTREDSTLDNLPRDRLPADLRDLSARSPQRVASHLFACREPTAARSRQRSPNFPRKGAFSGCNSSHQA